MKYFDGIQNHLVSGVSIHSEEAGLALIFCVKDDTISIMTDTLTPCNDVRPGVFSDGKLLRETARDILYSPNTGRVLIYDKPKGKVVKIVKKSERDFDKFVQAKEYILSQKKGVFGILSVPGTVWVFKYKVTDELLCG